MELIYKMQFVSFLSPLAALSARRGVSQLPCTHALRPESSQQAPCWYCFDSQGKSPVQHLTGLDSKAAHTVLGQPT